MTEFEMREALPIRDKWVLSSAVQKLIRRGGAARARSLAVELDDVSPGYLQRRLPVIAYEDIGVAVDGAVLAVLRECNGPCRTKQSVVIEDAVVRLAEAVKSRTACDAACLCSSDPNILAAKAKYQGESFSTLREIAANQQVPWEMRAAALEILCDRHTSAHGTRSSTLEKIADDFQLPDDGRTLFKDHNRDVRPMAVMLPLAYEAMREATRIVNAAGLPGSERTLRGIPLFALDMYSRVGRTALAAYVRVSPEIRRFRATCRQPPSLLKAVSMAVFHLDSCRLTRHLISRTSELLRDRIETLELSSLGVAADERPHLYAAITAEADLLNAAREETLRGLP